MPPKRRTPAKSERQPHSPFAAELAATRSRVATLATRSPAHSLCPYSTSSELLSPGVDRDLLTPGPRMASNLFADAIAASAESSRSQAAGHAAAASGDAEPTAAPTAAPTADAPAAKPQQVAGDAVACMFAYTAGVRMMGGQHAVAAQQPVTTRSAEASSGGAKRDPLQLEPDEEADAADKASNVASLRQRFNGAGSPPSARHRMVSPKQTAALAPAAAFFDGSTEVLIATLSPRPEAGGEEDCDELIEEEACGRVLDFESQTPCEAVLAVTVDETAKGTATGIGQQASVPELSPVAHLESDPSAAPSRKGSPETVNSTTKAKDSESEAKLMKQRLEELEAANMALSEQSRTAASLIEALASSPSLLTGLGAALSPELHSKLRATTSAGDSPHQKGAGGPDFNQLLLQVLTRSSSALAAAETAAEATADDGTTKVSHDAGNRDAQLSGHGECDKSDAKRVDTALPPQPQPQQQQVARSRKKASASAGGQLFRCCSAPQRVEN